MSTIGKVTLQSDENGLITLQCDRCKSRFKMQGDYLNNDLEDDICCPICGISGKASSFLPEEVIEEAKELAIMEAEEMLQDAFKGLNSKYIKVKTTPIKLRDREVIFRNKDYDMQIIKLQCCQKNIALAPGDISAGYYCPYCGRIAK